MEECIHVRITWETYILYSFEDHMEDYSCDDCMEDCNHMKELYSFEYHMIDCIHVMTAWKTVFM